MKELQAPIEADVGSLQDGIVEIDSLPPVFFTVADRTESFLSTLGNENIESRVERLRASYSKTATPTLNYDELGRPFSYTYFIENFWKSACVFLQETPTLTRNIVDVGSGSGATLLAYLSWLDYAVSGSMLKVHVLLIDKSKTQLALAKNLLAGIEKEFRNLIISSDFTCTDFLKWDSSGRPIDVMLMGHVLNENRGKIREFLKKASSVVSNSSKVFIIERRKDSVWDPIGQFKSALAVPFKMSTVTVASPVVQLRRSHRLFQKEQISTQSIALYYPEHKYFVDALKLYFEAWEKRSVNTLRKIFDKDAYYYEKPYQPPLSGLDQIEEYWKNNVLRQRDIHPQIHRVAYTGQDAFAEWDAELRTFEENIKIKGVLILRFNLKTNRVASLHEYFRTKKTKNDRYPHTR